MANQVGKEKIMRELGESLGRAVLNESARVGTFTAALALDLMKTISEISRGEVDKVKGVGGFWCYLLNHGQVLFLEQIIDFVLETGVKEDTPYFIEILSNNKVSNPYFPFFRWKGRLYRPKDISNDVILAVNSALISASKRFSSSK